MKALLAVMHPRRLPFFIKSVRAIDYMDVLLAKNYRLLDAQKQIITFFLNHDYNLLIFTSDDTEIPYNAPKQILADFKQTPSHIITGWSKCRPTRPDANITMNPPRNIDKLKGRPVYARQYGFINTRTIKQLLIKGKYLIPVWFVGWSLTGMTREVVKQWKPNGWCFQHTPPHHYTYKGAKGFWTSSDLWFSYLMWKLGYSPLADLRVYVPHYPPMLGKTSRERASVLLVGKEPPEIEFIKKGRDIEIIRETKPYFERAIPETNPFAGKINREWFAEKFLGRKKRES